MNEEILIAPLAKNVLSEVAMQLINPKIRLDRRSVVFEKSPTYDSRGVVKW